MAFQAPTPRNLIRAAHAAYNRPRAASQGLLPAATFVPSGRIAESLAGDLTAIRPLLLEG